MEKALLSNEVSSTLHTLVTDSIDPEESTQDGIRGLQTSTCQLQLSEFISIQTPRHAALDDVEQDHRMRFMSDTERVVATHPFQARLSFRELDKTDEWHEKSIQTVLETFHVNEIHGLSTEQVETSTNLYGTNTLQPDKKTPVIILFLLQFMNMIIGLLLIAAIAALALEEWVEGLGIVVIVTLNAIIATIQEKNAGDALDVLQQMSSPKCLVIRNGYQQMIPSEELVPGDIVRLTTGDIVPADLRLLYSVDLQINEMILTGESEDVVKNYNAIHTSLDELTPMNMVFSSTLVSAGNAIGVVVQIGMNTRVGAIATLLRQRQDGEEKWKLSRWLETCQSKRTPLQESLHKLGITMGVAVIIICIVVFGVGMIRGDVDPKHPDRPLWLYMVMSAVSLAVSAVPEGLPMVVTICLSTGTADMVKKKVLVRNLVAVESLGASTVICTDKTGTLTEGKMTAVKMWGDKKEYTITGAGFEPFGDILCNGMSHINSNVQVRATLLSAALCCNTTLQQETMEDGRLEWVPRGNSSEAPLVVAAAKAGIWCDQIIDSYARVTEVPFSSGRKMMMTVNKVPSVCGHPCLENLSLPRSTVFVANVKGAPNYIIENCSKYVCSDGSIVPLKLCDVNDILNAVDELSSRALRVLAVAIRPMNVLPYPSEEEDVDKRFSALCNEPWIFLGLIASMDPPRSGVKESILQARNASIRTVMITGDYLKTAIAIANELELIRDQDDVAVDCSILRPHGVYLDPQKLDEITSYCSVFARAKPEDKIEIVKSLQRQGHVTAMTGDGVNDAPALQESDIGIAMGISGTAVAHRLSDMILMDDNFCSIVAAVEKGREIYTNIQRFVCFLLSTNFGEITLIFIAIAIGLPTPLAALQILVLNIFADGMAAVALSLEKGDGTVMKEVPRARSQPVIHGRLWAIVLINAFLIAFGGLIVFSTGLYWNFGQILLPDIMGDIDPAKGNEEYTNAICSRWNGIESGWHDYTNCASPQYKMNGTMQCVDTVDYNCISEGISRAQTMTFVFITHMEMLRAYTARSFTKSMFNGLLSNRFMQMATIGMIILTISITNTPFIMDKVFGFASIEWFCWLYAIAFAILMVAFGEIMKLCYRHRDRKKSALQSCNIQEESHNIKDQLDVVIHTSINQIKVEQSDVVESPRGSTTSASNSSESSICGALSPGSLSPK